MMFRLSSTGAVAMVLTLVASASLQASAQEDRGNSGWYVRFTPFVWFSNVGGVETLGIGEADAVIGDFVVPVGDSVLETTWAARLELGKGRVRALLNVASTDMVNTADVHTESNPAVSLDAAYDVSWFTTDVFGAVQIGPFRSNRGAEIYGGARYVRLTQDLSVTGGPTTNIEETWVDPVIGGRYFSEMGGRFWAMFNGDLGGFNVGSTFMLTLAGELWFRVAKPLDITMRYSYQEVDYDNGRTGADGFKWENGAIQGWLFGAVFKY